jgi:hypothetical protein
MRRSVGVKDEIGYEVDVSRLVVPGLVKVLRKHGWEEAATQLDDSVEKFGARTVTLVIGAWTLELIDDVLPLLEHEKKALWYIRGLRKLRLRPTTARVYKLELLPEALANYLAEDAIDGWVYRQVENTCVAYVVGQIQYHPPDSYHSRPAYVSMQLKANKAEFNGEESDRRDDGLLDITEVFGYDDLASGKTAEGCLMKQGLLKETLELKAQYLKELELFQKYHGRHSNQFYCTVSALDVGNKGDWRWSRSDQRYALPHPTRMYETPGHDEAVKIWSILATQFGIALSEKSIEALVEKFPAASGRDIKQLLKLTMKYCKQKNKKMNLEAFRICAMFRGIA